MAFMLVTEGKKKEEKKSIQTITGKQRKREKSTNSPWLETCKGEILLYVEC